jgi:hypothetical protein
MSHEHKELAEIKGYISRLYQLIRSRTDISLELSDDQAEEFTAVGDTIEDINTKLQIANSFQQEEIYEKITGIEKLLKQLLNVEDEKFTEVGSWMNLKLESAFGGPMAVYYGDLIGFVISESETSINIKEMYSVINFQGQNWRKLGFEPFSKMVDKTQEININKKSLLYITTPNETQLENFNTFRKIYNSYKPVQSPWSF